MKKILLAILLLTSVATADKKDVGTSAVIGASLYAGCVLIDRVYNVPYLDDRVCFMFPVAYTVGAATFGGLGADAAGALIVPTPFFIISVIEW